MIKEASDQPLSYNLREKYDRFNEMCFNGLLPVIPLRFTVLKGSAGVCRCKFISMPGTKHLPKSTRIRLGTIDRDSVSIVIDKMYLRSEQDIDALLIHEMIHAWFFLNGHPLEQHGVRFETMRKKLQGIVGFNIPVTEVTDGLEFAEFENKRLIVIVRAKDDGKFSYVITSPASYFKVSTAFNEAWAERGSSSEVLRVYDITSKEWTQQSLAIPVQRLSTISKARFRFPSRPELMQDLLANGKIISEVRGGR